jgi:hypothetical protein
MSEEGVIDPVETTTTKEKWPPCFGEYHPQETDCTDICLINNQCKVYTQKTPSPPTSVPELDAVAQLPDMSPHDFLVESLKGRYEIAERDNGNIKEIFCRKDGNPVAQVVLTKSGRYLFRTQKSKLQLEELESVKQASEIVKALLTI